MAQKITTQDIPQRDLERYYEFVQASKSSKTVKVKAKGKSKGEDKYKEKEKYIVDYRLRDLDGTYIKHSTKTFDMDKHAKSFIENLKNEHAIFLFKQENPGCMMTFRDVYEEYIKVRNSEDKPGTIVSRESILNSRVLPFFGEQYIQEIGKRDIIEWQNCFRDENNEFIYSDTYLRNLRSRLSAIFNFAVEYGYISANPAKYVKMGEKEAPERPVWDITEYRAFRKAIEDNPMGYYAFETLYNTGMRRGELLALTIGDIDFKKKKITISKSLSRIKGKDVVLSPKTVTSSRTINVGETLLSELKEHIGSLPDTSPTARIFPVSISFLRNTLNAGTEKAGLSPITIHCFRHSHISNLIYTGFSAVEIAKRVGHKSSYITHKYSHIFSGAQERMADAIDEMMKEGE